MIEHFIRSEQWENRGSTWVRGGAFIDGDKLTAGDLATRISSIRSIPEFREVLDQANGFFAIVHEFSNKIYLATDHVRSWPLYYSITDEVYISDTAAWIDQVGTDRNHDPINATEQLFTGYVSGNETINQSIKGLQAGEFVVIDTEDNSISTQERYYTHTPSSTSEIPNFAELDRTLVGAFQRFLEIVDGRPILLGLSAGYDSRLIALMLSRLGYNNVITYTRKRSKADTDEIKIARSIAKELGFDHISIRHTHSDYQEFYNSESWNEFYRSVDYMSKLSYPSAYITFQKLKDSGKVPSNAVVVRGHLPLEDGSMPNWIRNRDILSKDEFIDLIWEKNYNQWSLSSALRDKGIREQFATQILDRLPITLYDESSIEPVTAAVRGLESWYWQERLPKLLFKDAIYDYFGYDRWLPLVDREYFEYLSTVRYTDRVGKRIHLEYVNQLENHIIGDRKKTYSSSTVTDTLSGSEPIWDSAKTLVKALPYQVKQPITETYHEYIQPIHEGHIDDPRYGILPEKEFNQIHYQYIDPGSLLTLVLYRDGYFDLPNQTELDRALSTDSLSNRILHTLQP